MNELTLLRLHAASIDDLGIYPAAYVKGDVTTERTPWQDGWNAAVCAMTDYQEAIEKWFEELPDDAQQAVDLFLGRNDLILRVNVTNPIPAPKHSQVRMLLNMGDTFEYATADAEEVPVDAIVKVAHVALDYGTQGLIAWAAMRRGYEPLAEVRDELYKKARAELAA